MQLENNHMDPIMPLNNIKFLKMSFHQLYIQIKTIVSFFLKKKNKIVWAVLCTQNSLQFARCIQQYMRVPTQPLEGFFFL
jgi:hypothetical protein